MGQANRAPDLDVLPGFQKPPPGFGVVPFFWWLGDPLTKERLGWELEQMAGMGVSGYQINYAHSDQGGSSYGLTYPSEPPLFSPEWWKLTGWFMQEAKKQGAGISLSDYTLGFGQGWCVDEMLREHPDVCGQQLRLVTGSPRRRARGHQHRRTAGRRGRRKGAAVARPDASASRDRSTPRTSSASSRTTSPAKAARG